MLGPLLCVLCAVFRPAKKREGRDEEEDTDKKGGNEEEGKKDVGEERKKVDDHLDDHGVRKS